MVKSKLPHRSGSVALRRLNPIHKKGAIKFNVFFKITAKIFSYMKLFYTFVIVWYMKLQKVFFIQGKNAFGFIFIKMSGQLIIVNPFALIRKFFV